MPKIKLLHTITEPLDAVDDLAFAIAGTKKIRVQTVDFETCVDRRQSSAEREPDHLAAKHSPSARKLVQIRAGEQIFVDFGQCKDVVD